jgi:elongation factor 2
MIAKLWGDNYHDAKAKKWKQEELAEDGTPLKRCFVQFIMEPVIRLCRNIMEGNKEAVFKMLGHLEIVLKTDEKEKQGKDLFRCVFQKWINAAEALLEMIVMKLPSPVKAQKYRAGYLYEGPIDDPCGTAIKNCD